MAAASSSLSGLSTINHVIHRLFRPPPPQQQPFFLSCFSRPSSTTTTTARLSKHQNTTTKTTLFSFLQSPPIITSHSPLFSHCVSTSLNHPLSLDNEILQEQNFDDDDDGDFGSEQDEDFDDGSDSGSESLELEGTQLEHEGKEMDSLSAKEGEKRNGFKVPVLTIKEKKELASYAHSLGKKLKSQLVGKSGVTDNVASSFIETLEANELLKIKIHRTCPGELEDVVQRLEEATGSVVVGQIGRTVIVYRPSISKMEAEEKKIQARRIYVRRESELKPLSLLQRRGQAPKLSGRGRRGSSRV